MDPVASRELLERISLVLSLTDPSDHGSVEALRGMLAELHDPRIADCIDALGGVLNGLNQDPDAALGLVAEVVGGMLGELDRACAGQEPLDSLPSETQAAAASTQPLSWSEDDREVLAEFVEETTDALAEADALLLGMDRRGTDAEAVHALFRVFHSIKGVAGFLGLAQMQTLAHSTESLLDQVREGRRVLEGPSIDLVFESTAVLGRCLAQVSEALQQGTAIQPIAEADTLPMRIDALAAGEAISVGETQREPTPERVSDSPQGGASGGAARATRETVRIDVDRIDSLVDQIGELAIVEAMIANAPSMQHVVPRLRGLVSQLSTISRELQNLGMSMRMVPLRSTFQRITRMARDLSRKTDKPVRVEVSGETTEMDRQMVEQIADPLVHLVRNAVDHGLEDPQTREQQGKDVEGCIRLSAHHQGGNVVIEISDDGRGLDRDRILAKAYERGMWDGEQVMSDAAVFELLFAPGFSTAEKLTEVSGRGVGMDVVKRHITALRGRVTLSSTPGEGTTVQLVLPLTTAIIDGMLVRCGSERFILPTLSIVEALQPSKEQIWTAGGELEYLDFRDQVVPLVRLNDLLGVPLSGPGEAELVVVVEVPGRRMGLVLDEVLAQQQVVIKSLAGPAARSTFVAGGAILSDGRVGLILDVEAIGGCTAA